MGDPLSKEKGEQLDTSKKRSLIGHTLASASTPLSTLAHCRRPFQQSPYFSGGCEALFLRKQHCVGVPMKLLAFQILLVLVLLKAGTASPPKGRKRRDPTNEEGDSYTVLNLGNYVPDLDNYDEVIDLSDYEGLMDYGDQLPEVKAGSSLGPPTRIGSTQSTVNPRTLSSKPTMTKPTMLGLPGSPSSHAEPGLPTCLVCVCLGSSVYCDDADLESIPPLPKTTTYLYARFNRISRIRAGDFKGLTKLKKIDLSSNSISSIDDDALRLLPALRDLILPENQLAALPMLPAGIEVLDVRLNRLQSSGIQPEAFRGLEKLQFLYLADNLLDSIPGPLPPSLRSLHLQNNMIETMQKDAFCDTEEHKHSRRRLEDIRLDGNPINLGFFPSAYFCLPRLPTGRCC
ncbi:opticin isoform X1 [Prionailurus viverrinus]|uniref:opticin isoform X1 n=1 Tax=Prionailurus viverrinus TaxID=61388 RepID=UPI001FF2FBFD|nr:opticin isoform X1 [Prionailurus viverrinus]